jgi:hypothetical protein
MNKSDKDYRIMDFVYRKTLRRLIAIMGVVPVVVALEVPWAYFTTQGVSSRRDVE